MYRALLLDVGYVILDVSWPALDAYDAATGHEAGSRPTGSGGTIIPDHHLDEMARFRGLDGLTGLFRALAAVVPDELFDPEAVALMRDARAARYRVGVLSNDAYSFLGKEFFEVRPEFAALDAFVDSSDLGVRKPEPGAYLAAADALATAPEGIVFLDDTPECVEGALRVGMAGIRVDPRDRPAAFDQARDLLGLSRPAGQPGRARTR